MEQNINQEMIDTTDCLEAVSVMKGMKNFLFWLLLLALLASQGVFWLNWFGLIDNAGCPAGGQAAVSCVSGGQGGHAAQATAAPVPLASANVIAERAEQVVREVQTQEDSSATENQAAEQSTPSGEQIATLPDPEGTTAESESDEGFELSFLRLEGIEAVRIVRVANFVMFMAAMLYCLTMLMNLKISLTGKLGGINHICRAFFRSLFLLAFVTPWQVFLPGIVLGAMYLPCELLGGGWAKADSSNVWMVLYYVRFTGYWLVVMWLLLSAQGRSIKWARATLRRLGMSR